MTPGDPTTGCPTCDNQNVPLPTMTDQELLDLHRALHDLWRAFLKPFKALLERTTR